MNFAEIVLSIFFILVVMYVVDFLYIFSIKDKYGKMISQIQKENMEAKPTFIFLAYLSMAILFYNFADTVQNAAILGSSAYGIYNFVNLALLKDFRLDLGLIDTMWGGLLFGMTKFIIKN